MTRMRPATPASMLVSGCQRFCVSMSSAQTLQISHSSLDKHDTNHSVKCCSLRNSLGTALASESSKVDLTNTTTTYSSNGYLKHDRLLPCPSRNCAPRIEHLVVSEGGPVLEYICIALDFPPLFVSDLIRFGVVYYALVSPQPPPTATQEQIRIFKGATEPSVLRKRSSLKGKTIQQAQKTLRVTHVDQFVEAGTYLRVCVCTPNAFQVWYWLGIKNIALSFIVKSGRKRWRSSILLLQLLLCHVELLPTICVL